MSKFLQLHLLHSYGPSNLNRGDDGRPKSVRIGGAERLRISSQCLKRAWRTSEVFEKTVGDHLGVRTRKIGDEVFEHLQAKGIDADKAKAASAAIVKLWKASATAESGKGKDVTFLFSRGELQAAFDAAEKFAAGTLSSITHTDVLRPEDQDVDVALWGRMLAAKPEYNITAACSVSHAITTHAAVTEDDFFSVCDDLSDVTGDEGSGAGHVGSRQFGSGIYYTYVCVDTDLLAKNLKGRTDLVTTAIEGLIRAAATVSPTGMSASYASFAPALYVLAERGDQQPRSLASAFTKPVWGRDHLDASVTALERHRDVLDQVYGKMWDRNAILNVVGDKPIGSLQALVNLVRGDAAIREAAE